jgi:hypothetical protein
MDTLPREPLEAEVLSPEEAPAPAPAEMPVVVPLEWTGPNYHISLWDTPVTYLCLPCNASGMTLAEVETHVTTTHSLTPIPTPLAADYGATYSVVRSLRMATEPTYYTQPDPDDSKLRYYCCVCEQAGTEYWSLDFVLFSQHQEQRHAGQLVLDEARSTGLEESPPAAETPAEPPPAPAEA